MSTTVKDIEEMARKLLDDTGEITWKDKTEIFPWLHRGRQLLRRIRPDTQLASTGATITTLVELTDNDDVILEPDEFAECLAEYVVFECLRSPSGDRAKNNDSGKHLARFYELAKL